MNVVKLVVVDPQLFCIIDDEFEIWWYTDVVSFVFLHMRIHAG